MYHPNQAEQEWELDALEAESFEFPNEWEFSEEIELDSPFSEAEEMELAVELLEIADEAELEQFLGKLFKKAWRGIRKFGRRVLRPLGSVLKTVAKKALPFVGGALGSFIPIPGVGTAIGSAVGGALSQALELEMEFEGLSQEDQEFELARRYVRLAGATARQAALTSSGVDPQTAVNRALTAAVRRQLPGINVRLPATGVAAGRQRSGRWIRRGRKIMVIGV